LIARHKSEDIGFILHKRNYRESSQLLDIFTRANGLVSVIAKGGRSRRSPFYLSLQLFSVLEVGYQGKSDLQTLTRADTLEVISFTSAEKTFCGYYVNELLLHLLHRYDPHPELFDRYRKTLQQLAHADSPEAQLRYFEVDLLSEIGYGLNLQTDTHTEKTLEAERVYYFQPDAGAFPAAGQQTSTFPRLHGRTLIELSEYNLASAQSLKEAKHLMRYLLNVHLGDKPIKSRDLFKSGVGQ